MPLRPARITTLLLALAALAACGAPDVREQAVPRTALTVPDDEPSGSPSRVPPVPASPAAGRVGHERPSTAPVTVGPLAARLRPDVLVRGPRSFSPRAVERLEALSPAGGVAVFRAGTARLAGRPGPAVGVDPTTFRAFAAEGTAEATGVWQSVARGEAVASHALSTSRALRLGDDVEVGAVTGEPGPVRLGALATTGVPATDLLVDDETGRELGLPAATGMLLTAGAGVDPVVLAREVREITGDGAQVDLLTPPSTNPVALLTGSEAAKAFGAFSYRYFPDGTIEPDASWVRENIRTETVPIMGEVTCHRLMLPQLRGALQEVVDRGLAGTLTSYDGCYVPRFIERNPSRSISLHTWGIAIDMDASTNYRGIEGTMDPAVVAVFKRWGFRWGGDWQYTDPMHFEMGAILTEPAA